VSRVAAATVERRPPAAGAWRRGLGVGYMPERLTPPALSAARLRHYIRLRGPEPEQRGEQVCELAESLHAALEETIRGVIV
jgi:hypothetical protein